MIDKQKTVDEREGHAEQQQLEEINVFHEFAKACPLPLVADSAQNRPEPEPDILCGLATGEKVAFELGQAEDVTTYENGKGESYVASIQKKEADGGPSFSMVSPNIVKLVVKKLKKTYKSNHPIHLIVWSTTASAPEVDFWKDEFIRIMRSNGMGAFRRIWVFGYAESEIVFDFDRAELRDLVDETTELAEAIRDEYQSTAESNELGVIREVIEFAIGETRDNACIGERVLGSLRQLRQGLTQDQRRHLEPSKLLLIASWNLVHCAETAKQKQSFVQCVQNGGDKRHLSFIDHRFDQTAQVVKEILDEYRDWYSRQSN